MSFEGLVSALGVVFSVFFVLLAVAVYGSLVRQISGRGLSEGDFSKRFELPEAIVALLLAGWFGLNVAVALTIHQDLAASGPRELLINAVLTLGLVLGLVAYLRLRGFQLDEMSGMSRLSFGRALSTGTVLLFAAYPLLYLADALTRWLLGSGLSHQEIIELFNSSQTLPERIIIIVMAVAVAPIAEEFFFRFFFYGVLRRYVGRFAGIVLSALLFAAVHAHLPSFGPLFVLGSCFAIAYEWSGSILVTMTMHALFNGLMLTLLAFPQALPPS